MDVSKIKEYIGKAVSITYCRNFSTKNKSIVGKAVKRTESIEGEILSIEGQSIVLALNLQKIGNGSNGQISPAGPSSDCNKNYIRVFQACEICKITEEKLDFMTVRNYIAYCENLREGLFYKSQKKDTDFFKASDHFRLAMTQGFVNDDIMNLYWNTTINSITNFNFNRDESIDKYKNEINLKLASLNNFRAFAYNISRDFFKDLSDYGLKEILIVLFNLKSYDCAHKILRITFERYDKSLVNDIQKLIELPSIGYQLLFLGLQMEAMADIYENPLAYSNSYPEAYYKLNKLFDNVEHLCHSDDSWYISHSEIVDKIFDFAKENIKKIEIFKNDLYEELHISDSYDEDIYDYHSDQIIKTNIKTDSRGIIKQENHSLLFRLIFNYIKKNQERINTPKKRKNKSDNIASIKSRYDKCMSQLYNLFNFVDLFFSDYEDQKENKWQMALELINIYYNKLTLYNTEGSLEKLNEKKVKYRDAIKTDILAKLEIFHASEVTEKNALNFYHCCPRAKLLEISNLLLHFDMYDEYLLIGENLINLFVPNAAKKTPDVHMTFCYFQMAYIYKIKAESLNQEGTPLTVTEELNQAYQYYDLGKSLYGTEFVQEALSRPKYNKNLAPKIRYLHDKLKSDLDHYRLGIRVYRMIQDLLSKSKKDQYNDDQIRKHIKELEDLVTEIENNDTIEKKQWDPIIPDMKEILTILDGEFKYTSRICECEGFSSINKREIAEAQKTLQEQVKLYKAEITATIRKAWGISLGCFIQNQHKDFHTQIYNKDKDEETSKFYATLDKLSVFSKQEIVNTIRDTFENADPIYQEDKKVPSEWNGRDVIKRKKSRLIQLNVSLLIEKAKSLGIISMNDFHSILFDYCIKNEGNIDTAYYRCYYCMAMNPAENYTLETRIKFCELALEKCREYFRFNGKIVKNIDRP